VASTDFIEKNSKNISTAELMAKYLKKNSTAGRKGVNFYQKNQQHLSGKVL
jgi:hypothetical protein